MADPTDDQTGEAAALFTGRPVLRLVALPIPEAGTCGTMDPRFRGDDHHVTSPRLEKCRYPY